MGKRITTSKGIKEPVCFVHDTVNDSWYKTKGAIPKMTSCGKNRFRKDVLWTTNKLEVTCPDCYKINGWNEIIGDKK